MVDSMGVNAMHGAWIYFIRGVVGGGGASVEGMSDGIQADTFFKVSSMLSHYLRCWSYIEPTVAKRLASVGILKPEMVETKPGGQ